MPEHYYRDLDPEERTNADSAEDLLDDAVSILRTARDTTNAEYSRALVDDALGVLAELKTKIK